MSAYFITATGTGIGKTVLTTALAYQLKEKGRNVMAVKPVISGFEDGDLENDTALIAASLGLSFNTENIRKISPFRYRAAISPNLAAAIERREIEPEALLDFCDKTISSHDISTCFKNGRRLDVPLQMGTFSKAAGSAGGYIAGDTAVIDLIKNRARTLIYTTGLPPAVVGASLKALEIIENHPELCEKPIKKAALFCRALNLPTPVSSIVPVVVAEPEFAMKAYADLMAEGFLVHPIRPPTVPEGTARLRFSFSAVHKNEDVERLAEMVRKHRIIK